MLGFGVPSSISPRYFDQPPGAWEHLQPSTGRSPSSLCSSPYGETAQTGGPRGKENGDSCCDVWKVKKEGFDWMGGGDLSHGECVIFAKKNTNFQKCQTFNPMLVCLVFFREGSNKSTAKDFLFFSIYV